MSAQAKESVRIRTTALVEVTMDGGGMEQVNMDRMLMMMLSFRAGFQIAHPDNNASRYAIITVMTMT
jgi:hypothetical protein